MSDCGCTQFAVSGTESLSDSVGVDTLSSSCQLPGLSSQPSHQGCASPESALPPLQGASPLTIPFEGTVLPQTLPATGGEVSNQSATTTNQQDALTGSSTVDLPITGVQPAFIGICVDQRPDLVITPDVSFEVDRQNNTATVTWTITNQADCGNTVAVGSVYNRFYLSEDEFFSGFGGGDELTPIVGYGDFDDLYYTNSVALSPNNLDSETRTEVVSLGADPTPYLILTINRPNNIGERDLNNNFVVLDLSEGQETENDVPLNQTTTCYPEAEGPFTSDVEFHSGALIETHTLAAYQSVGQERSLTLRYDSTQADVQPIVHFAYENVQDEPGTQLMIARMSIQRGATTINVPGYTGSQPGLTGGEHFWRVPDQTNPVVHGALQADLQNQVTGVYNYQIERDIQTFTPGGTFSPLQDTVTGSFVVVNRVGSPFGNGWSLDGWQEIVVNPDDSLLLIDGDGTQQIFEAPTAGAVYTSPSGDFSRMERLGDGRFQRTMKDQTVYTFNAQNQLETVRDRNGNVVTYVYNPSGQLTTIRDAAGLETTFTYTGDRVTQITDPTGRSTQLAYDAAGNLEQITDPDNSTRTWEYDTDFRMTAEIDKRGNRETTIYDSFGRVDRGIRRDDSTVDLDPVQVKGLYLPTETIDPNNAPLASLLDPQELITPTARMVDGRGNATTFTLNSAGNLLNQTDAVGNVLTIERDCDCGRISAIVDGTGDITTFTYDDRGNTNRVVDSISGANGRQLEFDPQFNQLIRSVDELGRETRHSLDATGNIIQIQQVVGAVGGADDRITNVTYLSNGLVDTMTDPLGRVTDYDYDARGRLTAVTYAQGTAVEAIERYEYDDAGNRTAFVDARGNRTTFVYDARNRLTEMVEADPDGAGPLTTTTTQYFYDEAGNLIRRIDGRGNETRYEYDAMDRLERIIEADPDGAGPLASPITSFAYDANGNRTSVTDARGNVTSYAYDARNRRTQMTEADPDGTGALTSPVTQYAYDLDNNLITLTDARDNATSFVYDARNRLTQMTSADPDGPGGALVPLVTAYQYNAVDLLTQITQPGDRATTYQYDELNRLIRVTEPDPDEQGPLTAPETGFDYDLLGNQTQVTDALGRVTTFEYDARNRLSRIIDPDPDGAGSLTSPITSFTYDATHNLISTSDPLNRITTFQYDGRNRLLQTTAPDPDGEGAQVSPLIRYSYDETSNLVAMSNALGHTTEYRYDGLNRQIEVIDPLDESTSYAYDAVDNLLSVTDPLGNQTSYAYDGLNRRVQNTNELGLSRIYAYDAMDNLTQMTNRNGLIRQFTYDNLDRRTSEQWLSDATVSDTISYRYDALGRQDQVRTTTTDNNNTVTVSNNTYTFDQLDRVTSSSNELTADIPTVVFDYSYDAVYNRTRTTDTIAGTLSGQTDYTYDALDRMTRIRQSGNGVQTKRVDMSYNVASELKSLRRFGGSTGNRLVALTNYNYDGTGRLTQMTHVSPMAPVSAYVLSYDAANRLTRQASPTGTADYSYDARDQLTGTTYTAGQEDEAYSYDANGNRTNAGYQTEVNNRVTSDGTFNYAYDDEGNLIRRTDTRNGIVRELEWDHRNRLVSVTDRDGTDVVRRVSYVYDGMNRRIRKVVDLDGDGAGAATTENFVYDGANIALVFDEAGVQTHRYLHGPGIDQILADEVDSTETRWMLTDHQGTVRSVLTEGSPVANHITYDSFGNVVNQTNESITTRFGYTGRELDPETGLMYNRARYYNPQIGRFISEDPIGFMAGDANLYRYVFNSPTNFTDPTGLVSTANELVRNPRLAAELGLAPRLRRTAVAVGGGVVGRGIAYLTNPDSCSDLLNPAPQNRPGPSPIIVNTDPDLRPTLTTPPHVAPPLDIDGPFIFPLPDDSEPIDVRGFPKGQPVLPNIEEFPLGEPGAPNVEGFPGEDAGIFWPPFFASEEGGDNSAGGTGDIQFGRNQNQIDHAFRHTDRLRLSRDRVQQEILRDIAERTDIVDGLNQGTVNVDGVPVDYHAFRLPNGTINIGRITGPRN